MKYQHPENTGKKRKAATHGGEKMLFMLVPLLLLVVPANAASIQSKITLRVAGGPSGSGKHVAMSILAQAIRNEKPNWNVVVKVGPRTVEEVALMGRERLEVATTSVNLLREIRAGSLAGQALPKPIDVRWIAPYTRWFVAAYVRKNSSMDSMESLPGNQLPVRISIGRKGTGPNHHIKQVFRAYGFTPKDIVAWGGRVFYQPSGKSASMIADNLIDGLFYVAQVPLAPLARIAVTTPLRLLTPKDPAVIAKLKKLGYLEGNIPSKAYQFLATDWPSIYIPTLVYTRRDISDEIAYGLARSVWENRAFLGQNSAAFDVVNKETVRAWGRAFGDLLHPGARRFYEDQGLLR